jgi:Fur family ferric uptake transcriptional regulator
LAHTSGIEAVTVKFEQWSNRIAEHLTKKNQRMTPQRRLIARVLFDSNAHLNADELHQRVRVVDSTVGHATVYRTLKLFEEYHLVHSHKFGDGTVRYEVSVGGDEHHDHLVCNDCGQIIEFENEQIEQLQHQVAVSLQFRLVDHSMVLYADCLRPNCVGRPDR